MISILIGLSFYFRSQNIYGFLHFAMRNCNLESFVIISNKLELHYNVFSFNTRPLVDVVSYGYRILSGVHILNKYMINTFWTPLDPIVVNLGLEWRGQLPEWRGLLPGDGSIACLVKPSYRGSI